MLRSTAGAARPLSLLFGDTYHRLSHKHTKIKQAFSENGALLASVGQDDNHCLAVHDWEKGKLQHTGPSDSRAVRKEEPGRPSAECCHFSSACVCLCVRSSNHSDFTSMCLVVHIFGF